MDNQTLEKMLELQKLIYQNHEKMFQEIHTLRVDVAKIQKDLEHFKREILSSKTDISTLFKNYDECPARKKAESFKNVMSDIMLLVAFASSLASLYMAIRA